MARSALRVALCRAAAAAVLLAAAGCGGGVAETADAGAVQPADQGSPPADNGPSSDSGTSSESETSDGGTSDGGTDGGYSGGSEGGPDVEAGGAGARAGSPFDVDAFEEEGAPWSEGFRDRAAEHCAGGKCIVTYEGEPSGGATEDCTIHFVNDPPKRPNPERPGYYVIQRGTQVIVQLTCPPVAAGSGEASSEESPAEVTPTEESPEGTTDGEATTEPTPAAESTDGTAGATG
jgi:hypothetical protein